MEGGNFGAFAAWMDEQPSQTNMAFGLAMMVLNDWYAEAGRDSGRMLYLVRARMNIGNGDILAIARVYLHLSLGDHSDFPEPARAFLEQSRPLLIPIFRSMFREAAAFDFDGNGQIDEERVSLAVNAFAILPILPEAKRLALEVELARCSERIPDAPISEETEAEARRFLENGEVPERHPAHAFLTRIVQLAPVTRELPGRARSVLALIGFPPSEE